MFLEQVSLDGQRLVVDSDRSRVPLFGTGLLRPLVAAGLLSQGRIAISYGPAEQFAANEQRLQLRRVGELPSPGGTLVLFEIPTDLLYYGKLPAETRVGAVVGQFFTAYTFFYPPLNQIEEVVAHFTPLELRESEFGFTCSEGLELMRQHFTAALPEGALAATRPRGTPSESYTAVPAGKMWVQSREVILEGEAVRLAISPWRDREDVPENPGSVDAIVVIFQSIRSMAWS